MKKKLLIGLACFAVIAAAATVTVSTINANTPKFSSLMLENLQVLSYDENGDDDGYGECKQITISRDVFFQECFNGNSWTFELEVRIVETHCTLFGEPKGKCEEKQVEENLDCRGIIVESRDLWKYVEIC